MARTILVLLHIIFYDFSIFSEFSCIYKITLFENADNLFENKIIIKTRYRKFIWEVSA